MNSNDLYAYQMKRALALGLVPEPVNYHTKRSWQAEDMIPLGDGLTVPPLIAKLNALLTRCVTREASCSARTRRNVPIKGHTCGGSPRPTDSATCAGCTKRSWVKRLPVNKPEPVKMLPVHSADCKAARGLSADASRSCAACNKRSARTLPALRPFYWDDVPGSSAWKRNERAAYRKAMGRKKAA